MTIPSRKEVEKLKIDWESDPCWDIEETEGFEAYFDELMRYRIEKEKIWKKIAAKREAAEDERLRRRMNKLGELGVFKLIFKLQNDLIDAEERICKLEAKQ